MDFSEGPCLINQQSPRLHYEHICTYCLLSGKTKVVW